MGTLKDRLTVDMRTALKARDEVTTSTLRMALAAVGAAEVAGRAKRELGDEEVLAVLAKEAKKRREAAAAFAEAGRDEQAAKETAEGTVLERYLPSQLSDDELAEAVAAALTAGGFTGMAQMGPAMKAAQSAVAGRAAGGPGRRRGTPSTRRLICLAGHPLSYPEVGLHVREGADTRRVSAPITVSRWDVPLVCLRVALPALSSALERDRS